MLVITYYGINANWSPVSSGVKKFLPPVSGVEPGEFKIQVKAKKKLPGLTKNGVTKRETSQG